MSQLIIVPLEDLKGILTEIIQSHFSSHIISEEEPSILTVESASSFLQISKSSLYALTSKRMVPHFKKGRKLYFRKEELIKWINEGKRESISQALLKS